MSNDKSTAKLGEESCENLEPIWIVNEYSELGVMVNGICYFLYKAGNIVYEDAIHDDGSPLHIRPLFKREFGECCLPFDTSTFGQGHTTKYRLVSLDDSDWWRKMPKPHIGFKQSYKRGPEFLEDIDAALLSSAATEDQ